MKKAFTAFIVLALMFVMTTGAAFADSLDFSKLTDDELTDLFSQIQAEMQERGFVIPMQLTLRDGKYIVGEDILPGTYKITCISTEGEALGGLYSSLGDSYDSLGEDAGWGALMGSLGGMMEELAPTTVEILGDYGTVLRSFEMKKGDVFTITLTAQTALQISAGCCTLEAN